MKILRSMILCGCTTDEASRCCFKSWNSQRCLCPCHFSNEQTERLVSAYCSVEHLAALVRRRLKIDPKQIPIQAPSVRAACGHEIVFEKKPSSMATMYVQQNPCDDCKEARA